jgi:hypothetical protein
LISYLQVLNLKEGLDAKDLENLEFFSQYGEFLARTNRSEAPNATAAPLEVTEQVPVNPTQTGVY